MCVCARACVRACVRLCVNLVMKNYQHKSHGLYSTLYDCEPATKDDLHWVIGGHISGAAAMITTHNLDHWLTLDLALLSFL